MQGSTCLFHSRTPTQWELDNCEHIELTMDLKWDPNSMIFGPDIECQVLDDTVQSLQAYDTRHRRPNIDLATLWRQWGISLEMAKNTLKCTTQAGIWHAIQPLTRHYWMDYMALCHQWLHTTFYSDTLFTRVHSLHGYKCVQVIMDGRIIHIYPMTTKSAAGDALQHFVTNVGILDVMVTNNTPELSGKDSDFQKACQQYKIKTWQAKPYMPRQNKAKLAIQDIKKCWRSKMLQYRVPKRLWDYGLVWVIQNHKQNSKGAWGPHAIWRNNW